MYFNPALVDRLNRSPELVNLNNNLLSHFKRDESYIYQISALSSKFQLAKFLTPTQSVKNLVPQVDFVLNSFYNKSPRLEYPANLNVQLELRIQLYDLDTKSYLHIHPLTKAEGQETAYFVEAVENLLTVNKALKGAALALCLDNEFKAKAPVYLKILKVVGNVLKSVLPAEHYKYISTGRERPNRFKLMCALEQGTFSKNLDFLLKHDSINTLGYVNAQVDSRFIWRYCCDLPTTEASTRLLTWAFQHLEWCKVVQESPSSSHLAVVNLKYETKVFAALENTLQIVRNYTKAEQKKFSLASESFFSLNTIDQHDASRQNLLLLTHHFNKVAYLLKNISKLDMEKVISCCWHTYNPDAIPRKHERIDRYQDRLFSYTKPCTVAPPPGPFTTPSSPVTHAPTLVRKPTYRDAYVRTHKSIQVPKTLKYKGYIARFIARPKEQHRYHGLCPSEYYLLKAPNGLKGRKFDLYSPSIDPSWVDFSLKSRANIPSNVLAGLLKDYASNLLVEGKPVDIPLEQIVKVRNKHLFVPMSQSVYDSIKNNIDSPAFAHAVNTSPFFSTANAYTTCPYLHKFRTTAATHNPEFILKLAIKEYWNQLEQRPLTVAETIKLKSEPNEVILFLDKNPLHPFTSDLTAHFKMFTGSTSSKISQGKYSVYVKTDVTAKAGHTVYIAVSQQIL